jgi:signal transduction histidine kinase
MPFAFSHRHRFDPQLYAIAAILGAAALVLYLEQRAAGEVRSQTALVLREIAEQTAQAVAADIRHTLEGPVFDTLSAVNHPQIRDSRLDLLAAEYESGLAAYPQVERFFVWTEQTNAVVPAEALFFGSAHPAGPARSAAISPVQLAQGIPTGFARDPELGRRVLRLARRSAPAQQIYAAYGGVDADEEHDAFLRLFWTDARRDRFFAVIGFIVDRRRVHDTLIPELHRRRLDRILKVRGDDLPFDLRVTDERGRTVWGPTSPQPLASRVALPMAFYPEASLGPRLASAIAPVNWTIEVSPVHVDQMLNVAAHGYWLPALSIALMLVALTFTIQAGRRAAAVARMQADFVSHVSHQLKTPLSLLSAATETVALDRVKSPEKLAQYLGIIRTEVGRLSSLVQRILEFSSVQQRRPLEFDIVNLSTLVHETVDAFQASLSGQHFAFRVVEDHGREEPPPMVEADPAALEQVLANLLDNAVKYSGEVKAVTVRVGWTGTEATVDVIDAGIGVSTADRGRIFEKFYRGSGEAHHRQGFGLGLAIAQELMAAHRGRIELCASAAPGSTFRITLPAIARRSRTARGAALWRGQDEVC